VDVPDEPPVQPDTPPSVQPDAEGDGFPVLPVVVSLAAVAAVVAFTAGAWYAMRRRLRG